MSTATATKTSLHGLNCSLSRSSSVLTITNLNQVNMQIFQIGTDCSEILLGTLNPNIVTSIQSKVGFIYFTKTTTDDGILSFTVQSTSDWWTIDELPLAIGMSTVNSTNSVATIQTTTAIKSISITKTSIFPTLFITSRVDQSTSKSKPTLMIVNQNASIISSGSINGISNVFMVTKQPLVFGITVGLAVCCIFAIIATILYIRKIKKFGGTDGTMYGVSKKNESSKFYQNESCSALNLVFKSSPNSATSSKKISYMLPTAETNNRSLSRQEFTPPARRESTFTSISRQDPIFTSLSRQESTFTSISRQDPTFTSLSLQGSNFTSLTRPGPQKVFIPPNVQRATSNLQHVPGLSSIPIPHPQIVVLSDIKSKSKQNDPQPPDRFSQPPKQIITKPNLEPNVTIEELLLILAPARSHSISSSSILLDKQRGTMLSDSDKLRNTTFSDTDHDLSSKFDSVIVFDETTESGSLEAIENERPVTPIPKGLLVAKIYRAAFTYKKCREDELSLNFADMVLVQEIFDDGWCSALLVQPPERRGMKGLIPWKCLEMPI
ncbi:hypothetical protein HK096_003360, partial [Nowakowskiella sp. JEL0078]